MLSLRLAASVASVVLFASSVQAQSIFTVAGGGTDDGRPATVAGLSRPVSVAIDGEGNLYVVDYDRHVVRRVDASTGIIVTVVGTGSAGSGGDGGPATLASLYSPRAIALDPRGRFLFVADAWDRVRRVEFQTGTISTFAGSGSPGSVEDGIPATTSSLDSPGGIVVDRNGDVYVVEAGANVVRRVSAATGRIHTVAGNRTWGFSGDGGLATHASFRLSGPEIDVMVGGITWGVALDDAGNLYVSDTFNHRVRKIVLSTGIVSTVAGTGARGYSGDGGPATEAVLDEPCGLVVGTDGDLYVVDSGNNRVRRVSAATGKIDTVAGGSDRNDPGDGGPATEALLLLPTGVATNLRGDLFITDLFHHRVRKVDVESRLIQTLAGNGTPFFTGDGGPATAAMLGEPINLFSSLSGDLFIADEDSNRVRRVDARTKVISTVAGAGDMQRWSGSEGLATEIDFPYPVGVTLDSDGNLYVACRDNTIRRISAQTGIARIFAGNGTMGFSGDNGPATAAALNLQSPDLDPYSRTVGYPAGLAFDGSGAFYFADTYNNRVRKIDPVNGTIRTAVGNGSASYSGDDGPATLAALNWPAGIAFDVSGRLFIADSGNNRVRMVSADGAITTVAGDGDWGPSPDGRPATQSSITRPLGVATDHSGNLYIAGVEGRILRVDRKSELITTVAGVGWDSAARDGGPAASSGLTYSADVQLSSEGDVIIAETWGGRVRSVYKCREVDRPSLLSPTIGSSGLATSLSLAWEAARGAFRYDVLLDTTNPPATLVATDLEATSYTPSNLQPLTTYYWRVVAKGDPYCEPFRTTPSEVWSFATASDCRAPEGQS